MDAGRISKRIQQLDRLEKVLLITQMTIDEIVQDKQLIPPELFSEYSDTIIKAGLCAIDLAMESYYLAEEQAPVSIRRN